MEKELKLLMGMIRRFLDDLERQGSGAFRHFSKLSGIPVSTLSTWREDKPNFLPSLKNVSKFFKGVRELTAEGVHLDKRPPEGNMGIIQLLQEAGKLADMDIDTLYRVASILLYKGIFNDEITSQLFTTFLSIISSLYASVQIFKAQHPEKPPPPTVALTPDEIKRLN
jgi:hypothetical protein